VCRKLQRVAVSCSTYCLGLVPHNSHRVLQYVEEVAACCSKLQRVAVSCFSYYPGLAPQNSQVDRKKPPSPGGFPMYYVPSSRTVCNRTPLEGFVTGSSRGVLLHTVLDEGT